MKKSWPAFIILFLAAHILYAQDEYMPFRCDVKRVGLDAEKFYIYFTKDTPYTSWQLWPEKEKLRRAGGSHGDFLTAYVNPAAYRSIVNKDGMAFGSLIVTENYGPDKKLKELAVMLRIKGYSPDAGDWYWLRYSPDGKVLAEGRAGNCISCHGTNNDNDYIMTAPVK